MTPGTLWQLLEKRAECQPDRELIASTDHRVTRGELAVRSTAIAAGLHSLGVGRGDRVAVFADNRLEHVELAFALNRIGASYVPVNPAYRGILLENALRTAQPAMVVVDRMCVDAFTPYERFAPSVIAMDQISGKLSAPSVRYEDLLNTSFYPQKMAGHEQEAMVLFTSGTTGPSKGVSMSNRFCLEVATANGRAREVRRTDRLHSCFAFCHANPIVNTLLPALLAGGSMAWSPRFSVSRFWQELGGLEATQCTLFTALLRMLLSRPASSADRDHHVQVCFCVGTPQRAGEEFEDRFGVRIVEGYGLTECGAITYQWSGARRLGSVGKPTPGWQVSVVDDEDRPVPVGTVGEIVGRPMRPGLLMDGYVGRPDATLAAFRNLWFHTGDRGYKDEDGFFWFVDRKKDAIRRRGENISSYEVEEAVRQTGLCIDSAAFAAPSPLGEDEVMVAVVPLGTVDPADLRVALEGLLPAYALPTYIRMMDDLPRTPTGKVQKVQLRREGVTSDTWSHEGMHQGQG